MEWTPESFEKHDLFDAIYRDSGRALPTSRGYGQRIITRKEVVEYLYKLGFRNVLILDNSCGDISQLPTRTAREIRSIKRKTRKEGIAYGGFK